MPSTLNPYLSFRDNTRVAMEFYRSVFGGKLDLRTKMRDASRRAPQRRHQRPQGARWPGASDAKHSAGTGH